MSTTYKYGLDFGTTNSSIAIIEKTDGVEKTTKVFDVDTNYTPFDLLRSVVAYNGENVYVGEEGLEYVSGSEDNPIRQVKMLLRDKARDGLTEVINDGKKIMYSDVMGEIFARLREQVKDKTDVPISGVVMGVPYGTTKDEKNVYLSALTKGGFYQDETEADEKTEFVEEPVAVALYYGNQIAHQNRYSLVFDFGGGTLDLAIVHLSDDPDELHKVIVKTGYEGAGEKLTGILFSKVFLPEYSEKYFDGSLVAAARIFRKMGYSARSSEGLWYELGRTGGIGWKFINEMDIAKQRLSFEDSYSFSFHLDETEDYPEIDIPPVELTREAFEEAIVTELDDINGAINKLFRDNKCKDAGITRDDIDEVLLAGGSSVIPAVQKRLVEIFGKDKLYFNNKLEGSYHVDTSISEGLALAGYRTDDGLKIDDVTSFSYGIYDGIQHKVVDIIPAGVNVAEFVNYEFSGDITPPEDYPYKVPIVQADKNLPYFFVDVREGDRSIQTLHFNREQHSGTYTLYFKPDVKRGLLEIHVYDKGQMKWVEDLPIGDRSIQIKNK